MLERDIEFYKICNNKNRVKFLELVKKDLMTQINSTFQIKVIIENSEVGFFWAYASNVIGINGGGRTIDAAKKEIFNCIEIQKELGNFPHKNYEVVFIEPVK